MRWNRRMSDQSHSNRDAAAIVSRDRILDEGQLITDDGVIICTFFVSLEAAPEFDWPNGLPLIAKGSSTRNAITNRRTVKLSKPEEFREQGETGVSDPYEGITRREIVRVDDALDLERAAEIDEEMRRGASALQVEQQRETSYMSASAETRRTFGKNGWILCTALAPGTAEDRISWLQSLDGDYDCLNTIASPRKFALALAAAVAEQLGPRGSPMERRHPYGSGTTEHPSQFVFHGPVAYVDDPHDYVARGASDFERTLRAAFFKHSSYAPQREYRFVAWADAEPEERVVYLEATAEILAEVQADTGEPPSQNRAAWRQAPSGSGGMQSGSAATAGTVAAEQVRVPVALADDPSPVSMPMRAESAETQTTGTTRNVRLTHNDELPARKNMQVSSSLQTVTVQTSRYALKGNDEFGSELRPVPSARNARAHAAQHMFHNLACESDLPTEATAALLHAERAASRLLLIFVDPIERIRWDESEVVLDVKMPADSNTAASIVIGPRGSAQYKITRDDGYEHAMCENAVVATEAFAEELQNLGLRTCQSAVDVGHLPMLPSIAIPSQERPDAVTKHTAQLHRRTSQEVPDIDEAAIDAAIAATEPRPDDARIAKLVVDAGPNAVAKLYDLGDGLSGTCRQRARRDQVSIHVRTMNPDATVQIDPPDSAPGQQGHVVTLPAGEDTVITITAASPDGTAQSEITYIAQRIPENEPDAA